MKKNIILLKVLLIFIYIFCLYGRCVNADNIKRVTLETTPVGKEGPVYDISASTDFWGSATEWFKNAKGSYTLPGEATSIISTFEKMINVVGTTIIVMATIILGIKYILGSVESQTSAKEGLITLLVACIFFFGWTAISNLLMPSNDFIFIRSYDTSYEDMVGRLFYTFTYIANIVVIISIIYVGVRYILAGAEGRSELKGKSIYLIIGIILAFATTNVLTFISKVINETL